MSEPYPIFIVGCPRSGTKLIRALLNNHPDISLGREGYFIPRLVGQFGRDADLSQVEVWRRIHASLRQTNIYRSSQRTGQPYLTEEAFIAALIAHSARGQTLTWAEVLEAILRGFGPRSDARIFGDKSHGYIDCVPLLRTIFSNVRFIHIVRDPRDHALSVYETWGRSPLRAAQGWVASAQYAERFGFENGADAFNLRYEDLTADPESELKRACGFLEVPFVPSMVTLTRPAQRNRHRLEYNAVVKQQAKYRSAFPEKVVRQISEITFPYLERYGYDSEGVTRYRPLSGFQLKQLSYLDGWATLRYHVKDKGLVRGVRHYGLKCYEGRRKKD